jgi:L-alanine-DL-glutamate epimerase-like enolase superfamily enzyme
MALSAIDVALWDLHAQLLGIPLHLLLGLPAADHAVYAAGGSRSLSRDGLVAEANRFKADGYRGYKMRIGSDDWRADVERVAAVRETLGREIELMVDANQAWDAGTAIQVAEALEPLDIAWFEEPVDAESMTAMAAVRARSPIPVAAGETVYGSSPFHRLVEEGCLDVLQPDLMRCGGLTGFLEIADLAKRVGLRLAPHLFTQVSPHILARSDAGQVEHLDGWFDGFFAGEPLPEDGVVHPGSDPGLGISISADAREHWTVGTYEP